MIKINLVSKEQYDKLMKSDNFSIIRDALYGLSVETETQALEVSLLKWKILSENENLSRKDMYYIGANTKSCGLCRLYKNDCLECSKFTGFKMDKKKVCFREYDDWFDLYNGWSNFIKQRPSINEPDFRGKARHVHDVLYECYHREVINNDKLKK